MRLVAVGAGLVVVPWVVRNERAVGVAAVSTLSPSSALAGANCARAYQGPGPRQLGLRLRPRRSSPDDVEADGTERAPTERELADVYRAAATDHVREDLGDVPRVVAAPAGPGLVAVGSP